MIASGSPLDRVEPRRGGDQPTKDESATYLSCELETILKNGNREVVDWHGREEESKLSVADISFSWEGFDDLLKTSHPTLSEIAVLKQHPRALSLGFIDQDFCFLPLTLA